MQRITTFILIALLFSACSASRDSVVAKAAQPEIDWLNDGVISLSRPLPEITNTLNPQVLGFIPVEFNNYWLKIEPTQNSISLMLGNESVHSVDASIPDDLHSSTQQVALKQLNPTWYATPEYYQKRNLSVPAELASERFLKGALGEQVLFLSSGLSIHASDFEDSSVGGIRLKNDDLQIIFSSIKPDDQVIIQ